ncbi:MAG: flagellar motor protein MotD [Chromatiales bacterium]|jgi:chemotaxis protein MotB|nr:flagellar motor protein MotD [Chromatiales bacterium]
MARRKHEHEDHVNHEAWAIPYGDLITLLLAFFVVMYAVSSVNEGKYRVLSDSLVAAFRGQPHTYEPISIGTKVAKVQPDDSLAAVRPKQALKFEGGGPAAGKGEAGDDTGAQLREMAGDDTGAQLREMAGDLAAAMQDLIDRELIRVQRTDSWIEVEINTDILFPSGSAAIDPAAVSILERVATILATRPWPVRVEGHTDDRPISTLQFPSNWELSAARAARIVRLLQERGISPARLTVAGFAEQQPVAGNDTPEGRNRNRRVVMVILGGAGADAASGTAAAAAADPAADPAVAPPPAAATAPATTTTPAATTPPADTAGQDDAGSAATRPAETTA